MGLLRTGGDPLVYGTSEHTEAKGYVRHHGLIQLIALFNKFSDLEPKPMKWGDEIEYILVQETIEGQMEPALNAADILTQLNTEAQRLPWDSGHWVPEFGSFMIESTPAEPYTSETSNDLLKCEESMAARNALVASVLIPQDQKDKKVQQQTPQWIINTSATSCADLYRRIRSQRTIQREYCVTLTTFPRLGADKFLNGTRVAQNTNEYSQSLFVPDVCINQTHPRFRNLVRNIRLRRGRRVCIQVPLYIDRHTLQSDVVDPRFHVDAHPNNNSIRCAPDSLRDRIDSTVFDEDDDEEMPLDAIAQQQTIALNYFYAQYFAAQGTEQDKLVAQRFHTCPCPSVDMPCVYMDHMAFGMGCCSLQVTLQSTDAAEARHLFDQLTVICPFFLALTAGTPVQKGLLCDSDVRWSTIAASVDCRHPCEVPNLLKSRYDSVSLFISPKAKHLDTFNDLRLGINEEAFRLLVDSGVMDERLARHFAFFFVREPLVMYEGRIDTLDDQKESDHFENIQSTNWQTVRFKPPPAESKGEIGWRVEFRVCEVQLSTFENAALATFVILLSKALLHYNQCLYMPLSKVDENMGRAHLIQPETRAYWFRFDNISDDLAEPELRKQSLDELFNGTSENFGGFVPLVRRYMAEKGMDCEPRLVAYCDWIAGRASGKYATNASVLRRFVQQHPDYRGDSRVTPNIARDIALLAAGVARGDMILEECVPVESAAQIQREAILKQNQ